MIRSTSGLRQGTARVVCTDAAGATLGLRGGLLRATWGGALLVSLAAAPDDAPRAGDLVDYVRWPDGVVTVERVHESVPRCG